jgi:hypothetical protein
MTKRSFTKPPLTTEEKEKVAEQFMNFSDTKKIHEPKEITPPKKEPTKTLYLRAPQSYWDEIHEIMALTGLSMNAVCLGLLRPAIKRKLKELKED